MKNHTPTFKASNTSQTLTRHHKTRVQYGAQNAMDTDQQDTKITTTQNNMERHRSLKHTALQADIQKNSEKQSFTHSGSKKNRKEIPKVLPSANMRKRVSNMHESTRRFNVASRKNPKEHYHYTTPTNRNPAEPFGTALII